MQADLYNETAAVATADNFENPFVALARRGRAEDRAEQRAARRAARRVQRGVYARRARARRKPPPPPPRLPARHRQGQLHRATATKNAGGDDAHAH